MKLQNFQLKDRKVVERFIQFRQKNPKVDRTLSLSWSNWGFGTEPLHRSVERLSKYKVAFVEMHGNRYGPDLGYRTKETRRILDDHGVRVSGVCSMISPDCELSSNRPFITQRAIDYLRRNADLCAELGGGYIILAPGAVGRPKPYDESEFSRAAEAMRIVAEHFLTTGVRGAIEPIRAAETSICHAFSEAKLLIDAVNHPGIKHIAGDIYHMYVEEEHISTTILSYGHMMTSLHLADSNRKALGLGSMDLDLILMALYVVGYNDERCFCSAEPLGPAADPYLQMFGEPDAKMLDALVEQTARHFYEREHEILSAQPVELER